MEYSSKLASCRYLLALAFAMAAAVVVTAQNLPADYLTPHNAARAAVGVAAAAWDTTVANDAQTYADARKGDCSLVHSPAAASGTYGENLFWGSAGYPWAAANATKSWVDEKQYYTYATNTCAAGKVCGHYTQVVWRSSTAIGCGRVVCDNGKGVFIICNYKPPGNYNGQRPY